jgi:aminopeptidase N
MEPKTIHLKDYAPAPYLVDRIRLEVDIFDTHSQVTSELTVLKRPEYKGQKKHLELNGENLTLIGIKLNGQDLTSSDYQVSEDKLVVLNRSEEEFTLVITNTIYPSLNKAMEGFYQSGEQLCTQCEPEGFRKITYFIDRPDNMARFQTKMISDKKRYPYLLSNGNKIGEGELPGGRHWVEWEDPFRKPSYLFAMVAGDFDVARDTFTTMKGRKVSLELFVDKGNLKKTPHAMASLKNSMKWDEETYGLEYDLDIYMIVAVDSFNMGAMENKGLNIFNSTYTLADQTSATDSDFQGIQGVIGHEYFHNWSGNRVTCRDWFQLTLKEGLTVYRDQEFSSDMLSRAVKRLEDVRLMKEAQFAEDAGPMSHPIRPSSYIEINNFYTRTVYEKGAEVIRMIDTLLGKDAFNKGLRTYFSMFDGQAVTTEDFLHAMEVSSGKSLKQFQNWYSRPGTPTLIMRSEESADGQKLHIEQKYPPTTIKVPEGNVLHMPLKLSFLSADGSMTPEETIEITKLSETFSFKAPKGAIPSLNRGFSAPVHVDFKYEFSDLIRLMSYDSDPYCRFEATQKVYLTTFKSDFETFKASGKLSLELSSSVAEAMKNLIADTKIDDSFKSYLLDLPSESVLSQDMPAPDFEAIHVVLKNLRKLVGLQFKDWFLKTHAELSKVNTFDLTPAGFGRRSLKNQCLSYLTASGAPEAASVLERHYNEATNMTEEISGLAQYIKSGVELSHPAIQKFYQKWKHDSLVMQKWFSSLAAHTPKEKALERIEALEKDPIYKGEVPNYLRALYLQFAKSNLRAFHAPDGSGYKFIADRIQKIDGFNPQVASRTASAFSMVGKVDSTRKEKMREALNSIMSAKPSRDTFEVVSKYLAE